MAISDPLWELMESCWAHEISIRPTAQQAAQRLSTIKDMTKFYAQDLLPAQLWENIIDIIAGFSDRINDKRRKDLARCHLVCRTWAPLCRLYISRRVIIGSREDLHSIAASLQRSPFHVSLVEKLNIRGVGAMQDWITTVPLNLPKLPAPREISFTSIDFKQQHPSFNQYYSLLKSPTLTSDLGFMQKELTAAPVQIARLAAALKIRISACMVNTSSSVMRINSWPHSLASRMTFRTEGYLEDLCVVLSDWIFPVRKWTIVMESTKLESFGAPSREALVVWREIFRVASLSLRPQFEIKPDRSTRYAGFSAVLSSEGGSSVPRDCRPILSSFPRTRKPLFFCNIQGF